MILTPEQDYKLLLETAPGLYLVLSPDFTIVAASDAYLKATMTVREAILGRGLFEVFPDNPEDTEADGVFNLRASLNYVRDNAHPHPMAVQKYDIRRPDGVFEVRYWSPLNTPVFNAQNELAYIIHNVTDVTSRVKSEEELKKNEKYFQLLLNNLKDYAIIMLDKNGIVKTWNSGAEHIKGYQEKEIIGKSFETFYSEEDIKKGEPRYNLEMTKEYGHFENEGWRLRKDGSFFWANIVFTALIDESGNLYGYSKITRDITERKNAEEKLRKSKREYQLLVSSVKDYAIFLIDTNGCVASWNSGAESIKGYTAAEITGQSIDVFYTAGELEKGEPEHNLQMALQHGHFETEGWRVRKDGTLFWADIVFTRLIDESGNLYGYSKITRDITERKKGQEELELLSRQINQVNDSIYTTDKDRKIKSWNQGAENLYGYTKEEMMGKDPNPILKTALTEDQIEAIVKEVAEKDYWTSELKRTTKSGAVIWVRSSLTNIKDDKGEITGYVAVSFDITLEKKLRDEINHLANMVEQSTEAIISIGADQRIISWNRGAEKLHGYSKEEAIGKTSIALGLINLTEDEIKNVLQQVVEKKVWHSEMLFLHKDGSSFFGEVTANLIKDEKGEITGFLFIVKDISVRKQLEKQLKEFEHFFNNSNDLSCIANKEGYFEILNPGFKNTLGYTENELSENPFLDFVHPDDIPATLHQYDKLKAGAEVIHFLNRYRKKDGSYLWFEWNATPNPVTGKLYCIARDITDRKKAEDALSKLNEELEQRVKERTADIEKNEKRFRTLIENNYDIISLLDESFKVIYRSPSASRITGWSDEDLINSDGTKNIHPDDREKAGDIIKELMANPGKPVNCLFRNRHKDGHYLWVEGTVINLLQDAAVKAIVFNFRDITERVEAEIKIKKTFKELSEYKFALDESGIVAITDQKGIINYVNNNFCKISKYTRKELIGQDHRIINSGQHPKEFIRYLWATIADGKIWKGEIKNKAKDGSVFWADTTIVPFLDEKGKPWQYVAIQADITERKQAEEKLVSSEMLFRSLIENIAEGIAMTDEFSNNLYRSPSAERILGTAKKENTASLAHPEDVEALNHKRDEAFKNPGIPITFQGRFLHASGHYIWLELTLTNLLHVKGVNAVVSNYRDITERKELEDLLHKANVLARIGGWEIDMIKGTVYWSDITREIHETEYDYVPDLATGINFYKEGKGRDLIIQKVKEAIESGKPWDVELQIITAKNNERWIRTIGEAELINGKCVRIYGSFQDIDDRKRAEKKLIESEKLYRNLFTNMLHGFAYCKAVFEGDRITDYTYIAVNSEYEALTGLNDITGKKMSELMPDLLDSDPVYYNIMKRVVLEGKAEKYESYVAPLKKWFSISLYSPQEGYFVSLVDNITQRKEAEEKIIASEKQFRTTLDNMLEGAQIIGFDWRYIYVNDSFTRHSKYSREEMIGHTVMEKFPGIEQTAIFKIYQRCFNERVSIHLENEFTFPDNTIGWFELSFQPIPEGIFILSIDITERKKGEEKINKLNNELEEKVISRTEQLKKTNEELEAFSYSVSHDLRAPLRAIVGFSTILEEDYSSKLDEEARRLTTVIKSNTVKMGNLIDDLLAFSRTGRHEMVKIEMDTNQMVKEVISEMGIRSSNSNTRIVVDSLPPIEGDVNMMRQVWVNLISNATKYSTCAEQPHIEIGSYIYSGQTVFFVKDNGVGFDEKYKNKLFKVFQRLHSADEYEGTGIGLAIVEKIIAKHGGKVWVEAAINKGATFYFSLPGR